MHLSDTPFLVSSKVPSTILSTPRLTLRAAHPSDLQAFHSFLSDPEVMHYWSGPPFTEIEQSQRYLAQMIATPNNGMVDFVLVLADDDDAATGAAGTVIGKAGIWTSTTTTSSDHHHPRGPEVGLLLHREYWGQGYTFEAMKALIPQFWKSGVESVVADVDPRNQRSLRLLRRCGFVEIAREEKTIETHLGWCDSVILRLRKGGRVEVGKRIEMD